MVQVAILSYLKITENQITNPFANQFQNFAIEGFHHPVHLAVFALHNHQIQVSIFLRFPENSDSRRQGLLTIFQGDPLFQKLQLLDRRTKVDLDLISFWYSRERVG